jgi:hypothetical protein
MIIDATDSHADYLHLKNFLTFPVYLPHWDGMRIETARKRNEVVGE